MTARIDLKPKLQKEAFPMRERLFVMNKNVWHYIFL